MCLYGECVHACLCVCVRACVGACVRACVHVCVFVNMLVKFMSMFAYIQRQSCLNANITYDYMLTQAHARTNTSGIFMQA